MPLDPSEMLHTGPLKINFHCLNNLKTIAAVFFFTFHYFLMSNMYNIILYNNKNNFGSGLNLKKNILNNNVFMITVK